VGEGPVKRLSKSAMVIQPAIEYIQENYCSSISLNTISSLCEISPSYFSKLFKKVTKQNLVRYINSIRVKQAENLLATTNKSISQIAVELGFEDCGYFIKVFKKETGLTPNTYRNATEE
jgi:YesN/AraC family two-component response regulator